MTVDKGTDGSENGTETPDLFFVSGPLTRDTAQLLYEAHGQSQGRNHCVLVLTTSGGDANAAYLAARHLRRSYEKLTVCVFGYCKSAGTLLALGAHELVIGERGELGPLDVQVSTKDEIIPSVSGLEIFASIEVLTNYAFGMFEQCLLTLIAKSDGQVTTRTAAQVATELAVGVLGPVAAQIDPLRLGHEQRALDVAARYAERLGVSANVVARLTGGYPSHGFVIDLEEAAGFLPEDLVRAPTDDERLFERRLADSFPNLYYPDAQTTVRCLNPKPEPDAEHDHEEFDDGTARDSGTVSEEAASGDSSEHPVSDQSVPHDAVQEHP